MASIPSKGDRLVAKVDLTVYVDRDCKMQQPPLLPGPNGLKETVQYPGTRKAGEEVGTWTGNMSEVGYEVNFVLTYRVAQQQLFKWTYNTVIKQVILWVKKDQVTGFWDTGVDAPVIPKIDNSGTTQKPDNTNIFLGAAVVAAAFLKFKPKSK